MKTACGLVTSSAKAADYPLYLPASPISHGKIYPNTFFIQGRITPNVVFHGQEDIRISDQSQKKVDDIETHQGIESSMVSSQFVAVVAPCQETNNSTSRQGTNDEETSRAIVRACFEPENLLAMDHDPFHHDFQFWCAT
jgi:hypothetical protein